MKKILLSEPIDQAGIKLLEGMVHIIVSPNPSDESIRKLVPDADGMIVRTATQVTRETIKEAPHLKVISRTGGGLNNVDVEAATDFGVVVCGVKGVQDRSVAEHTVALMCVLAKHMFFLDKETRKGHFNSRFEYRPIDLAGKQVGLIGLGRIGRLVAQICRSGFNMEVTAFDPYLSPEASEDENVQFSGDMSHVVGIADILSIHVPFTEKTRGLIGMDQFSLMKPTALLINTSRGEIVNEDALIEALRQGLIAGAGLDVFEEEPPNSGNPLFGLENVIVTPHSAALTRDTVSKLAEGAAENVLRVLEGKEPTYSANWDTVQSRLKRDIK